MLVFDLCLSLCFKIQFRSVRRVMWCHCKATFPSSSCHDRGCGGGGGGGGGEEGCKAVLAVLMIGVTWDAY